MGKSVESWNFLTFSTPVPFSTGMRYIYRLSYLAVEEHSIWDTLIFHVAVVVVVAIVKAKVLEDDDLAFSKYTTNSNKKL